MDSQTLKKQLQERLDLTFLEFVRLTRDYTLPMVQKAIDEVIAEGQLNDNPFARQAPADLVPVTETEHDQ